MFEKTKGGTGKELVDVHQTGHYQPGVLGSTGARVLGCSGARVLGPREFCIFALAYLVYYMYLFF